MPCVEILEILCFSLFLSVLFINMYQFLHFIMFNLSFFEVAEEVLI